MNELLKAEVIAFLKDCLMGGMWGDGQEEEYILYGVEFKGLKNMSDQELYKELISATGEDQDLVIRVKCELGIEEMIAE